MEKKCKKYKPKECKYREVEGERFLLKDDYDWWDVIDTLDEFNNKQFGRFDIKKMTPEDVINLLNSWDQKIRELERDNKILRDVMNSDANRAVQSIVDYHSNLREERKYYDRVRFERDTLKKWYMTLNSSYNPAFGKKEFEFLRMLDDRKKEI